MLIQLSDGLLFVQIHCEIIAYGLALIAINSEKILIIVFQEGDKPNSNF